MGLKFDEICIDAADATALGYLVVGGARLAARWRLRPRGTGICRGVSQHRCAGAAPTSHNVVAPRRASRPFPNGAGGRKTSHELARE